MVRDIRLVKRGIRFCGFNPGLLLLLTAAALLVSYSGAFAYSSYFGSMCAACHYDDSITCNGCHRHGNRNLNVTTDQTTYDPGEKIVVTFSGGGQYGWVRGMLKDDEGIELDRKTGPTFSGNDGGSSIQFPMTMTGFAPGTAGTYYWKAYYYGSGSGGSHTDSYKTFAVTVAGDAAVVVNVTPDSNPAFIPSSGGVLLSGVYLENPGTSPVSFDAWVDVTLPNGAPYGPVQGPVHLTLPGGGSLTHSLADAVPGMAPSGVYKYNVYLGDYGTAVYDADSFDFVKEP